MTLTVTLCAVSKDGSIVEPPSIKDLRTASSIHALAFSSNGDLLVCESEGTFNLEHWEHVFEHGRRSCGGDVTAAGSHEDVTMTDAESLEGFVRRVVRDKLAQDQIWRAGMK